MARTANEHISVDDSSVAVWERSGTYVQKVWLTNGPPTEDVTLTIASSDANVVTVSTTTLTFTPSNWSDKQDVTYTGVDNNRPLDPDATEYPKATVTYTASSADAAWNGITHDVTVWSVDDEPYPWRSFREGTSHEVDRSRTVSATNTCFGDAASITMTYTSSDPNVFSVSPATLTWTAAESRVNKTLTLTFHDNNEPGDVLVTLQRSGDQACIDDADEIPFQDLLITVLDDNDIVPTSPGVTVAPTALTIAEGDQHSYRVVLDTRPAGNVTITPTSDDENIATVSPTTLTFTPHNWDTPQTITVATARDDDHDDESVTIRQAVSGYGVIIAHNVHITVRDGDDAGVTVAPTKLTVKEGDEKTYKVVLNTRPAGNVTITPTSDDENIATVSPTTLTFTPHNWDTPQTITVTAEHDDDHEDGSVTIRQAVSGYSVIIAHNVHITVRDDDTAGVTVTPTRLTVKEGDQNTYKVVLDTRPTNDVTITPTSGDENVATASPATLTFTPDNWNRPQKITATGIDDDDAYTESIFFSHAVSGYGDVTTASGVLITVDDDDSAGVTVKPTALTITEGDKSAYKIVLDTRPANDVTVTPTSGDEGVVLAAPPTLTFTRNNWNHTPDNHRRRRHTMTMPTTRVRSISHAIAGYHHVTAADDVVVACPDDDTAGVTITPTALTIAEGDESAYTVVLDTRPANHVTITPTSGDKDVAAVSPATLTFAPDNWNQPQTITLAATHDDDAYDESATITHAIAGYDDVTTADEVVVAVPDDDTAGVTIASAALTIAEGNQDTYTVVLTSRPANHVTVTPTSSDEDVATVRPETLTFTPDNWNQPQTITLAAKHDDDAYDESVTISHAITGYDDVTTADEVIVAIPDDDTAGVTVASAALTIAEGNQDTYTVVLTSRPANHVTVTPTSGDEGVATVRPETLTFTPDNWNTPQTITVAAKHDDDAYDESVTISHAIAGYGTTTAAAVQVAVNDDDTAGVTVAPTALIIPEGDQDTYTVVLDTRPANHVTVTPTSRDKGVATVSPATLTFSPDNWNTPQTITVAAKHDDDAYDASTTITHGVSGYDHVTTADEVVVAIPGVTIAPAAMTIAEGDESAYTVVLDTQPANHVTITSTSGDKGIATVSPETLTFTPDNWNQPQTVTVAAKHDDDAYDASTTITHDVSGYHHITTADEVVVTIPDDETAGVTVAPTALTINEGDQNTYTVVLDTQPANHVTITSTSSDEDIATVRPATLTFTPDNWNTPQTITVVAKHDDDAYDASTTITHAIAGYDHVTTAAAVQVAVNDDDTPGATIAPTRLTVNEGDESAYTVVLDTRPANHVTITPISGDENVATLSPATLTFTPDNWNTPQTITATGIEEDDAYHESTTITHTISGYDHVTAADEIVLAVLDDDTAGVRVAPTALTIAEGDESAYTVVLNTRPANHVTITSTSGDESVATVRPETLTFTPDNWNTPQAIILAAEHDDDAYDASTTITHAVSSYDHVTTAAAVQVAVNDDDTPGATIAPTRLTVNEGDESAYTVVLDTRPANDVTITSTSGAVGVATVSPETLTFSPDNWNTPQTVTVAAEHDDDAYDESVTISHAIAGYDHVTTTDEVVVAIPDDDTAGVTIAPTALTITEGDQDTYTVVLTSRPANDVTITPTSGDEGVATLSPATLTFAPDNWNQPQAVTVAATHDDDAYDESTTITHAVSGYDHITTADEVVVAIPDDDTAGVTVAPTALTIAEGDQDTYTVVLDSRPATNVTIIPTSGDEDIATVSPETLTFTPDNWNTPQTITLAAEHDDDAYDESVTITHDVSGYGTVTTADNVQISIPDDDTPGVTITPTALTIAEGDESTYTVVLDTRPATNVTITSTSGDEDVATLSPPTLAFAPDNWNQPQAVTLATTHDDDAYDESVTITHDVSGYGTVTTAATVQITVNDDDTAGVTVASTALTIAEGDQDTYTVVLDTQPANHVTITPTSGDEDIATLSPETLTFTSDNWNQPQAVTLTATHDDNAYDESVTITHPVSGYGDVTTADEVVVAIPDDDTPGVTIAPTTLTITEGDQDTYTVVLDSRPANHVTVTPTSGDKGVATVRPKTLTFAPDNWSTPQTVTVAATHDDDAYDASTTITHAVSGYDHVTTTAAVQVAVNDDDTPGATVEPTTLTVNEGDQNTYTVVLDTRPTANVTITPTSGDEDVATLSPKTLTFTPDNWNQPQTITLATTHDDDAYDASATITHDVSGYDHVTTADEAIVAILDDDTAGVTVAPTALTINEGDENTYTVVLDYPPS